ncbi:MAG: phosphatidylinositol-specific phospholipase C domain-containing protein [Taibaiella sp.]
MSDHAMINFQIFPSQYEENGDGEKCCWLGGQLPTQQDLNNVQLRPYQTDAIPGRPNPDWGFHLLDVPGEPEKYRLKYVKMSDPDHWWYGVTVNEQGQLVLQETEGVHFIVRKLGAYYTLEYNGRFVESENGNLGATTLIKTGDSPPPPPVTQYDAIPKTTFRVLWKFIKMDHMSGREWQTKLLAIDKDLTIDKIFFPGTHDSGTEGNKVVSDRCQYHTIPEQCAMGVRYFDLRVADDWDIYHGLDSGINLKDVLDAVIDHLKNHGEEFFILQVTPETSADFSKRLNQYLIDNFDLFINNYAYTTSVLPTLDTAKGKIIFFARGYEPIVHDDSGLQYEYHIGWEDNIPGGYSSSDPFPHINVWVQDRYDLVPDSTKFDEYVNPALKKMFVKDHNNWIINFCSVANGGPLGSSEDINPWVANRLMWTPSQPTGLLMLDGARVGSIANIIALNFS